MCKQCKIGACTYILYVLVTAASCKKEIEVSKPLEQEKKMSNIASAAQDSLETMYLMQSNPELILADRIISKSYGYVLDISENEAQELAISAELYRVYVEKVKELNNDKQIKIK